MQWANRIFDDYCKANTNGIQIYSEGTQTVVIIDGFGTSVFGNEFKNVFLDPDKIDPEKIAYFINQLIKAYDKNTSDENTSDENTSHKLSVFNTLCSCEIIELIANSASAGSLLVLSSFLKNQNDENKESFFKEVVEKLFPSNFDDVSLELQNNAQKLMEYIAKKVNFVNPPGILFNASVAKCLDLKLQSLALGKQGLASEGYFIEMIRVYLSGGFKLCHSYGGHNNLPKFGGNNKHLLISSVTDEMVFPLYYVLMFAEKLKELECCLDDKKISDFVYKVMQYGDIVKKDGGKCELDEFCKLAIEGLELSDNQYKAKVVSDMAQKYLNIRNEYLALQKTYSQSLQKEYLINLFKINERVDEKGLIKNFYGGEKTQPATPTSSIKEPTAELCASWRRWSRCFKFFFGRSNYISLSSHCSGMLNCFCTFS